MLRLAHRRRRGSLLIVGSVSATLLITPAMAFDFFRRFMLSGGNTACEAP